MGSPIGNSQYTPPINPQTNLPYTTEELQGIVDTLTPSAESVVTPIYNSSGQLLIELPLRDEISLSEYVSTLNESRVALEQFLKKLAMETPLLSVKFTAASAENIESLLNLASDISGFNLSYEVVAQETNTLVSDLNANRVFYNNLITEEQSKYNALVAAINTYNTNEAQGTVTQVHITAYQTALAEYTTFYNQNLTALNNYNTSVISNFNPRIEAVTQQISSLNSTGSLINDLADETLTNPISIPLTPLTTHTMAPPPSSTLPLTGPIVIGSPTINGNPNTSFATIPALPTLPPTISGDYTEALTLLNQVVTTQRNLIVYTSLNSKIENQTNIIGGNYFFNPLPYSYIKKNTNPMLENHPTAFLSFDINTSNQKLTVGELLIKNLLEIDPFSSFLPTQIKSDSVLNEFSTKLTSFFFTLLVPPTLIAQSPISEEMSRNGTQLTLLMNYVNELSSNFTNGATGDAIALFLRSSFPNLSEGEMEQGVKNILNLFKTYGLLTAILSLSAALGVPPSTFLANVEGVSKDKLMEALQGNPLTQESLLNDPYIKTVLLANLYQLNGTAPLSLNGQMVTTEEATQNALLQGLNLFISNPMIGLEGAFISQGFEATLARTLSRQVDLFLNNEIKNTNLDTTVKLNSAITPFLIDTFLNQYGESEASQLRASIDYTLQTNPQSLREFSIDFENRLLKTFTKEESLNFANEAVSVFESVFKGTNETIDGAVNKNLNALIADSKEKEILTQSLKSTISSTLSELSEVLKESPQEKASLDAIKVFTKPNYELTQTIFNSITAASNFTSIALGPPNIGQPVKASTDAEFGIGLPRV
jgi:hypothetical protein